MAQSQHLSLSSGSVIDIVTEGAGGDEQVIVLPGLRYGPDRPLLKAIISGFAGQGCDIACAGFIYAEDAAFMAAPDEAQLARIASDGCEIIDAVLAMPGYRRGWIIGKSLGTLSMGAALARGLPAGRALSAIWLTPSLRGTPLLAQMLAQQVPSLVVMGTEDGSNLPELTGPLVSSPGIELHLVAGADHGFEHAGGAAASAGCVAEAAGAVTEWARRQRGVA